MPQKFVLVAGPFDGDDASGVGCGNFADVTGLLTIIFDCWVGFEDEYEVGLFVDEDMMEASGLLGAGIIVDSALRFKVGCEQK